MDDKDSIAADIVAQALAQASELEAQAKMLRERIADPAFVEQAVKARIKTDQNRYDWEAEEDFPDDLAHSMWTATTTREATGEGRRRNDALAAGHQRTRCVP